MGRDDKLGIELIACLKHGPMHITSACLYICERLKAETQFTSYSPHVPLSAKEALDNCLLYLLAVLHTESRLSLDIGPQMGLRVDCSLLPAVAVEDPDKSLLPSCTWTNSSMYCQPPRWRL